MTTQDLAKAFTEMCSKGEFDAAGKKFWSDDIVSREPMTGDMAELKGRKAVERKGEWWYANHLFEPTEWVSTSVYFPCDYSISCLVGVYPRMALSTPRGGVDGGVGHGGTSQTHRSRRANRTGRPVWRRWRSPFAGPG